MSDEHEVIIKNGGSAIRLSDDKDRTTILLFLVSQFHLTVDEVKAVRSALDMDDSGGDAE